MMKNTIDIIVVTYNRLEYFNAFVVLLQEATRWPYRLIVVDNGSTDGTRQYIQELHELGAVGAFAFNNKNLPLAQAFNVGFELSTSEYVVTVADDMKPPIIPGPCWLEVFLTKIKSDDKIGCINFVAARRDFNRFNDDYKRKNGHSVGDAGIKKRIPLTDYNTAHDEVV